MEIKPLLVEPNPVVAGLSAYVIDRAGLDPKTAATYAIVARAFTTSMRMEEVTFSHHEKLAISDLTNTQRQALLKQAVDNGWSSSRLKHERDDLLGRLPPPTEEPEPSSRARGRYYRDPGISKPAEGLRPKA